MPELPDIAVYIEALASRLVGQPLERVRIPKPFLLRSVDPPINAADEVDAVGGRRMGKRIVLELGVELFLVIHLPAAPCARASTSVLPIGVKIGLAAFDFPNG